MRTSKAKFEFRKIVHLIEQSEMMVLPSYFLAKTSKAKSEVRKQAHLAKRSNGVTSRDFTSDIPLERMKDVEVRIFKSHLQGNSLHNVP